MRLFIRVIALACIMALGSAGGAPAADQTVGVVLSGDLPCMRQSYDAFVEEMAKAGYGKDKVDIYLQKPNPDPMSWTNSVRKFVAVEADVIVTFGAPATLAALRETGSVPVVFGYVYDPDATGVKKSNSSGASSKVPMVTLLRMLKSVAPVRDLAVVYNPNEPGSIVQLGDIKKSAASLGFQVLEVVVKNTGEVRGKVAKAAQEADSLFISCSAVVDRDAQWIIDMGIEKKLPVITQVSGLAEKGALLALAPSPAEQGELAAKMAAGVLNGGKLGGMPVEGARRVDLVFNLKTAGTLGLKVPFDVLNAATKVIK